MALLGGHAQAVDALPIQRWLHDQKATAAGGGGGDDEDTPEKIAEKLKKALDKTTVDVPAGTDAEEEDARMPPADNAEPHDAPADNAANRLGSNIFKHVIKDRSYNLQL